MPDGLDYLLRPVLAGAIKYESLIDGTLSLYDVAIINDAIYCKQENERRFYEHERLKNKG